MTPCILLQARNFVDGVLVFVITHIVHFVITIIFIFVFCWYLKPFVLLTVVNKTKCNAKMKSCHSWLIDSCRWCNVAFGSQANVHVGPKFYRKQFTISLWCSGTVEHDTLSFCTRSLVLWCGSNLTVSFILHSQWLIFQRDACQICHNWHF